MILKFLRYINSHYLRLKYAFLKPAFSIVSHLTVLERIYLYRLANGNRIYVCLEIGSYFGASAYCLATGLANKNVAGKVLCIDTWNNDAMSEGEKDTFEEFCSNTTSFSEYIIPIRGFSTNVIEQVSKYTQHVDILFIDGDHQYGGVKADWEAYKHFLKPGSIVVFHDWGWSEGVKRVVEENVMPIISDFDNLPNMWWGTIKNDLC